LAARKIIALAAVRPAARSSVSRLLEGQSFETLHVDLATRLVVRDSTAPPKKS
jgi:hypothetical protein